MINDIFLKPFEIEIEGKIYVLEFDNAAYVQLEQKIGKGIFGIMDCLINGSFGINDYIQTVICGLVKNHTAKEIAGVKKVFEEKPYILLKNVPSITTAYLNPLMPPEVMQKKMTNNKKNASSSKK